MPNQLARRFYLNRHVSQLEADRLMLDDRLAERLALPRIRERGVERGAGHPDRLRRNADPPRFQIRECNAITVAFAPKQVGRGYLAIVEHDLRGVGRALPELLFDACNDVTRRLRIDDESGDSLFSSRLVRHREDDRDVRILA